MTIFEKVPTVPDGAAMTVGGTVSGFLVGLSAADIQTYVGIGIGLLTGVVLIQRIIINRRTLRAQQGATPPGNSE